MKTALLIFLSLTVLNRGKHFPTPYPFLENEAHADTISWNCESEDTSTGVIYDGHGPTEVQSRFDADQRCTASQSVFPDPNTGVPANNPCVDLDCTQVRVIPPPALNENSPMYECVTQDAVTNQAYFGLDHNTAVAQKGADTECSKAQSNPTQTQNCIELYCYDIGHQN